MHSLDIFSSLLLKFHSSSFIKAQWINLNILALAKFLVTKSKEAYKSNITDVKIDGTDSWQNVNGQAARVHQDGAKVIRAQDLGCETYFILGAAMLPQTFLPEEAREWYIIVYMWPKKNKVHFSRCRWAKPQMIWRKWHWCACIIPVVNQMAQSMAEKLQNTNFPHSQTAAA